MSFANELWVINTLKKNGYDLIYKQFIEKRKRLKYFIYMLTEKYDSDTEYSKNLKKIYDLNFEIPSEGTLCLGIRTFKNDLLHQYESTIDYVNKLKEKIIEPLKKFLFDQQAQGKKLNFEMTKIDKDFREAYDKLEKSKMRYHSFTRSSEEAKISSEIAKNNTNITNDQKAKLNAKCQNALKIAKDAEKDYINLLNYANNNRDFYIENTKKILNEFQSLEESFIEFVKDILKYHNFDRNNLFTNLQTNHEANLKCIENIDTKKDIKDFIEKNAISNSVPPNKFEFIPYHSEVLTKPHDQNLYPNEVINSVRNFIQTSFLTDVPESEPDPIEAKNYSDIQITVNNAWDGRTINEEEKKIFMKFMKEKKYRKYTFACLNKFRISGLFSLDEKSYNTLGDLLNRILDEIVIQKDFESAKYCMILSQTFFKPSIDISNQRIFLQNAIENHEIWKNIEFWEQIIKFSINEEMNCQNLFSLYNFENPMDEQIRTQNIIFGQLISFIYNMLSLDVSKDVVKKLILEFCKTYKLNEELSSQILKNVDEYNTRMSQCVKNEIVDDNLPLISDELNGKNIVSFL